MLSIIHFNGVSGELSYAIEASDQRPCEHREGYSNVVEPVLKS